MKEALEEALAARVERAVQLAGGASKEAWAVDTADGRRLLVRRAGGGVIHRNTLSLRDEFEVLVAAREAGVRVPEPFAYLGEVDGREAFAMERVEGETIGRRIVRDPPPGLALELAEELARIHAIPADRLPFLPAGDLWEALYADLDAVAEPHPAIEYGLAWCRERLPLERPRVVSHGDFRVGNFVVGPARARGGARLGVRARLRPGGRPRLAVRARVAVRRRRPPARRDRRRRAVPRSLRGADRARVIPLDELYAWEVLGNCKWAIGALGQTRRHLSGEGRDVEYAILGRLAAEMEYELLDLIGKAGMSDRPSAGELAAAVRDFLEGEILPALDDRRLRFRTLVAMNALGIVERESPPPPPPDPADAELARRLRAGDVREGDLELLRAKVPREAPGREPAATSSATSEQRRRRLYLMRHGEVAYFDADGKPLPEDDVGLTEEGRAQAEAAAALLALIRIDRVITSGLRRTVETASLVVPGVEAEAWPELRELRGAKLSTIPEDELEEEFVHVFRGVVPARTPLPRWGDDRRALRPRPPGRRPPAGRRGLGHRARGAARRRQPRRSSRGR